MYASQQDESGFRIQYTRIIDTVSLSLSLRPNWYIELDECVRLESRISIPDS